VAAGFDEDADLNEARKLARSGQFREAIAVLENSPATAESGHRNAALAHFYYMLASYETARLHAERALSLLPRNRFALITLGDIYFKLKQWERAAGFYSEADRISQGNPYTASRLSSVFLEMNRAGDAVHVLERALEGNSEDVNLLEKLELAYRLEGLKDKSSKIRSQIEQLTKKDDSLNINQLVKSLNQLEPEKAIQQAKRILELPKYREDPKIHESCANLLAAQNRFEEAIPHFEKALSVWPRSDSIKLKLAHCLNKSNRPEESLKLLNEMRHLETDRAYIETMIEAEAAGGNGQMAIDHAIEALLKNPKSRQLRRLVNELRKKGLRPSQGLLE
jgi:tetratricopeptide (TPR) repeat protein